MKFQQYRRGFTLIELLFVIVILGIVGGITLEAIRQYYEGIYRTQEYNKRVSDADEILDQLTKYFEYAISGSIVNLDKNIEPGVAAVTCDGPPKSGDTNDSTVGFIGVDNDSMRVSGRPGWSEETRLLAGNELNASDANYTVANNIITALDTSGVLPAFSLTNSAIYDADSVDVNACRRFSWDNIGSDDGYHHIFANNSSTSLTLNAANPAINGKQKYLLRTGYAFRVLNNGNFMLYSNFRPWLGENYTAATRINVLGQNVAHFYADYNATDFMNNSGLNSRGMVWKLKVCMRGLDANLSTSVTESQAVCRERRVHVRY